MIPQILKFPDSSKVKYYPLENKTFFLQIKKFIHYTLMAIIWKKKKRKEKKKSDGELVIFVMLSGFCVLMGWVLLVGLLKENSIQNSFLKMFRKCVSEFSYTLAELFNMG